MYTVKSESWCRNSKTGEIVPAAGYVLDRATRKPRAFERLDDVGASLGDRASRLDETTWTITTHIEGKSYVSTFRAIAS